jgi:hypothetical protein
MYPPCDIDKVLVRGETWAVDPEMREAFDRLGADLRGEIRTAVVEMRVYVDERLQTSEAGTRAYIDDRLQGSTASLLHEMQESESRMRRHFDVVGESLRADNRSVAEGTALLSQRTDRRFDEEMRRTDGLEGRVVQLEVRVRSLEDDRKPRRPRRRR